jgi:hypothetical protein
MNVHYNERLRAARNVLPGADLTTNFILITFVSVYYSPRPPPVPFSPLEMLFASHGERDKKGNKQPRCQAGPPIVRVPALVHITNHTATSNLGPRIEKTSRVTREYNHNLVHQGTMPYASMLYC